MLRSGANASHEAVNQTANSICGVWAIWEKSSRGVMMAYYTQKNVFQVPDRAELQAQLR